MKEPVKEPVNETGNEPKKELTELEKLRAQRHAFTQERDAKQQAHDAAIALEVERRAFEAEQALAKFEDEHGADCVELVQCRLGATIVKKPSQILFRNFQETGKPTANSFEKFVRPCLLYPTIPEWERFIKEQPAHLTDCAHTISRLAGVEYKERVAK